MNKLLTTIIGTVFIIACMQPAQDNSKLKMLTFSGDSVSAEPYLFTDTAGTVYLSWVTKSKNVSTLSFSRLINDAWTMPTTVSSGEKWFVNWADYPVLASGSRGNMIAHFLEKSENGKYTYDVKLLTSADAGNTWNSPKILNEDGKKAEHGFVSIVPYNEEYFVAWLDGRNSVDEEAVNHKEGHQGQMTLRGALIDKNGKKTNEWELDNRVCDCCQTTTAITANGPVVIYRDRSEDEIRDISIVRLINGQWTEPKPVFSNNWKIAGCPVNGPRVDALGNSLAVAWFSSPNKKGEVSVIFSQDGGKIFGAPIRVDEGQAIGRVDVSMLDGKTAMVSWMEGSSIKAAKIHADGKKDASIVIASTSESRSSGFPQMVKSGSHIVFAWTDDKLKIISTARLAL